MWGGCGGAIVVNWLETLELKEGLFMQLVQPLLSRALGQCSSLALSTA